MRNCNIAFIGLDIDDKNFNGGVYVPAEKREEAFKCKPTFGALMQILRKMKDRGYELRICYESSYTGYPLCRNLRAAGFECEIIASSLIPEKPGKRVKTDRIDAAKLARLLASDMLTAIYIPDEKDEQVRDLIRTRNFYTNQLKKYKLHILSLCRRYDIDYHQEVGIKCNYWTIQHMRWLQTKIHVLQSKEIELVMSDLLVTLEHHESTIKSMDKEIDRISGYDRYKEKVDALKCMRGIDTYSAMTLVSEIGDINRFSHPAKLVSYAGLDVTEYSSGGKERKGGLTKMGNKRIRTTMIESCQSAKSVPSVGRRLKSARQGKDAAVTAIADRCMNRLHSKSTRLIFGGKTINKVKAAAGREMLCFVWEILKKVA